MSVKTGRLILRITGWLTLIPAVLLLLVAGLLIFGGGVSMLPDYGIDIESTVTIGNGLVVGIGIIILFYGIVLLLRSLASFAAARDSRKYFWAWIFAVIDMIRSLADAYNKFTAGTFGSDAVMNLFLAAGLNILIFVAANTIRNDAKRYL